MSRVKILRASAGSGKTYRLSFEYIKAVVLEPRFYGAILAVTFTNKATSEMKRRILGELNSLSMGRGPYLSDLQDQTGLTAEVIIHNASLALRLILQDYSCFSVSTIDKFFQRIVRSFLKELDLDFNYVVELDQSAMLAEAVDRLIERSGDDRELRYLLEHVMYDQMDLGRNWDIRSALMKLAKDLFSKEQYVEQAGDPMDVLDAFREIKSVVELRVEDLRQECHRAMELIAQAGLEPTDFKQTRSSFASYFARIYNGQGVISKYNSYYTNALESQEACYTEKSPHKEDIIAILPSLTPYIISVAQMYDDLEPDYNSVEIVESNFRYYLLLSYLDRELKSVWRDHGRIPIHQTNKLISRLVEGTDVPFIYEKVGTRYSNYMIDEFQDTSRVQWRNFVPLLAEAADRSVDQSVMLIGDVKQAIYRWRGGDWSLLAQGAGSDFESRGVDSAEQLRTNWRSGAQIVGFNNHLIRGVVDSDAELLDSEFQQRDGALGAVLEVAYDDFEQKVPEGRDPEHGYVSVEGYDAADDFGWMLLYRVEDMMMRGYGSGDIAVLVRRKSEGRRVADVLLEAGYGVVSDEALLVRDAPVVELAVAVFSLSVDRNDKLSLAIINGYMGCGYGAAAGSQIEELIVRIRMHSPLEAMEDIIDFFGLNSQAKVDGQVGYLQAFYQMLYDYCASNIPDVAGFLRWWAVTGVTKYMPMPEGQDAITIMTIHKSKGLEFKCVIIPFADWGLTPSTSVMNQTMLWVKAKQGLFSELPELPVAYSKKMGVSNFKNEYERETLFAHIDAVNMLYVAVTRAEDELYLMYETSKADLATRNNTANKKVTETPKTIAYLIEKVLGMEPVEWGTKTHLVDGTADVDVAVDAAVDTRVDVLSALPGLATSSDMLIGGAAIGAAGRPVAQSIEDILNPNFEAEFEALRGSRISGPPVVAAVSTTVSASVSASVSAAVSAAVKPELSGKGTQLSLFDMLDVTSPVVTPAILPAILPAISEAVKFVDNQASNALVSDDSPRDYFFNDFPTHDSGQRIRVNWDSERYFAPRDETSAPTSLTNNASRRIGVLLHSVLENINTLGDATTAIQQLEAAGEARKEEILALRHAFAQMQENPIVASWFDPAKDVFNERTIMTPGGDEYRPDRVVINNHHNSRSQAIVIDYKFGQLQSHKHKTQVLNYMQLLGQMGYSSTLGYLWYVEQNLVVPL